MILLRSVAPSFLLDPTISPGPDSSWCQALRQKKSLILVCREWYKVSLPLLYEDVCFRRISQLPVFLHTVESAPGELGSLVKRLSIYAFIPDNRYGAATNRYLRRLFDLCPRLTLFGYTSPCDLPPNVLIAPITTTHLVLGETVKFDTLSKLMAQLSIVLESLTFHVTAVDRGFWNTPTQSFPRLHSLLCVISPGTRKHLAALANMWTLPSLCHLTFKIIGNTINWEPRITTHDFVLFCSVHGKNLKSLHFHPEYWWSMSTYCIDIQRVVDVCSSLEHLILHPKTLPLTHPNVKWVDIWLPHVRSSCAEDWKRLYQSVNSQSFPSLVGIRVISNPLSCLFDIPRTIPPGMVNRDDEGFELEFPGIHVKHNYGHLGTIEPTWSDEGVDSGLDDDGDLYIYVSENEDEDEGECSDCNTTASDEDDTLASSTEDGTEGEENDAFFFIDEV
ncbi:hypothetical protein BDQ17DRAFT_931511 [Cyathus striatus]|nr:hypothetical protein BDQ17DRAFT_931511 [Cyathus striatus]